MKPHSREGRIPNRGLAKRTKTSQHNHTEPESQRNSIPYPDTFIHSYSGIGKPEWTRISPSFSHWHEASADVEMSLSKCAKSQTWSQLCRGLRTMYPKAYCLSWNVEEGTEGRSEVWRCLIDFLRSDASEVELNALKQKEIWMIGHLRWMNVLAPFFKKKVNQ